MTATNPRSPGHAGRRLRLPSLPDLPEAHGIPRPPLSQPSPAARRAGAPVGPEGRSHRARARRRLLEPQPLHGRLPRGVRR